ncbi:hypothetical protein Poli38472_001827 [Pythium oligandrum]|uniref:Uncharacterized protein n=1 Tax=Pythium oligandrum TaxID=41045 RepID=A0A8K1CW27_PYTOL|nr:hypothetical protein Poli38472_001827 [Pythium oligandrum]|eukprot:TMW69671.1 hypothetical protein Poli38472_001827 [Pythium oligandrum]
MASVVGTPSAGVRRPAVRMSHVFSQMLGECPQDIQVYGACVANITGGVDRGACEQEFEKLKQCFTRVLKTKRGGLRHMTRRHSPFSSLLDAMTSSLTLLAVLCLTLVGFLHAETPSSPLNATDWYVQDRPYLYLMRYVRAANGSWVVNPNATAAPVTWEDIRRNATVNAPPLVRWLASPTFRSAKKKGLKVLLYNFVSPMDWGNSIGSQRMRALRNKGYRMFFSEKVVLPMLPGILRNLEELFLGGIKKQIRNQLEMKRISSMTLDDVQRTLNVSYTEDELEEMYQLLRDPRTNVTKPYEYEQPWRLKQQEFVEHFQPYAQYARRYYVKNEDDLPPPSLPARVYPWRWNERLQSTREILLAIMDLYAQERPDDQDSEEEDETRRLQGTDSASYLDDQIESDSGSSEMEISNFTDLEQDLAMLRVLEQRVNEFHFVTGIPRLNFMRDYFDAVRFPSRHEFFNLSLQTNASEMVHSTLAGTFQDENGVEAEAGVTHNASEVVYATRDGIYEAAKHFYSFPAMEMQFVKSEYRPTAVTEKPLPREGIPQSERQKTPVDQFETCTVAAPCLVRSGVTVYTPRLHSDRIYQSLSNVTNAVEQRQQRVELLKSLVSETATMERETLRMGLQAPSTAWHSCYDREFDLFADALVGFVNLTKKTENPTPLQMFERLRGGKTSFFETDVPLYFSSTNRRTEAAMRVLAELEEFTEIEMVNVTAHFVAEMKAIAEELRASMRVRETDPAYQQATQVTQAGAYYIGRPYSVLRYGYFLPATNHKNVAYRDYKQPVPFHLVMRLLVRFQESRLILPNESKTIAACLALLQNNLRFYKCVQVTTNATQTA